MAEATVALGRRPILSRFGVIERVRENSYASDGAHCCLLSLFRLRQKCGSVGNRIVRESVPSHRLCSHRSPAMPPGFSLTRFACDAVL
eukprot:5983900-Amphidinium_carterae.1